VTGANYIDTTTFPGWRAFAVANAGATYRATPAAASHGSLGMEVARDVAGGDAALDMDDAALRTAVQPGHVYKFQADVKNGGAYGGTPAAILGSQFVGGTPNVNNRSVGIAPGASFQTFGITAASGTSTASSARFDLGGPAGRSAYVDNFQVTDVTYSNRMVNGGFENSSAGTLGWRFFAVSGATGSAGLSSDAHTGSYAALLDRTNTPGDSALDLWGADKYVAVLGGEMLKVSFASKKLSGVDSRVGMQVAGFDAAGNYAGTISNPLYDPSAAYGIFSPAAFAIPANVAFVSVGFRVMNAQGHAAIGSYLIDDVTIVPEPAMLILLGAGAMCVRSRRRVSR
jgi:hypothetical protein